MIKKINTIIVLLTIISPISTIAQDLNSSNYTLIAPVIGDTFSGTGDSTDNSTTFDSSIFGGFTTSTNFSSLQSNNSSIEANIPEISCAESTSTSVTTNCTLPGAVGMDDICGNGGCYDRAKVEINTNSNPADTRYALQISENPTFTSSNSYYIDSTTRRPKVNLEVTDFIPKCEWEGATETGVCGANVTFYQGFTVMGLKSNSTYYIRAAAQTGIVDQTNFSQTEWGPSVPFSTSSQYLTVDIDLASDLTTETTGPYEIPIDTLVPGVVNTSNLATIIEFESNIMSKMGIYVRSVNGGSISNGEYEIDYLTGDLALNDQGAGIIGSNSFLSIDASGAADFISDNIAFAPNYTDTGSSTNVGFIDSSYRLIASTNNDLPVLNAKAGFLFRAKASLVATNAGSDYTDVLRFMVTPIID